MKFHLLDRVIEASPDRVAGVKNVSLAEEYLADHFPAFPVLPGVLMLEAATQAAAWAILLRGGLLDDGEYGGPTVAVLRSARNVRYGHFVAPGRTLTVTATHKKPLDGGGHGFDVGGTVNADAGETTAFTGKLEIACFRLGDRDPATADADARLAAHARARWSALTAAGVGPLANSAAAG